MAASFTTDVSLALCRVTSCTDQRISSSFFWMYHIVDSLTLNPGPTSPLLILEQSSSNPHIYSIKHISAFLHLGTPDSTMLKGHFQKWKCQQTSQKCKKNPKNLALHKVLKGHLFTAWDRLKQSITLFSDGILCIGQLKFLLFCVYARMSGKLSLSIRFVITNTI